MSYKYSNFPDKEDFQGWEYFENINNTDKDNIIADREYLVDDNKRLSAQFVNIVLDAIRAIEKFVQDLSKKKPNMSDVVGTLPITHGGTGATTAANALKNLGLTATATELNYTDGVTGNIQTQLDKKLNIVGSERGYISYSNFDIDVNTQFNVDVGDEGTTVLSVDINGLDVGGSIQCGQINAHELQVYDTTTNGSNVYAISTAVAQNRLDLFKITGGDSLVKMTFQPKDLSANGRVEINGDVHIDNANTISCGEISCQTLSSYNELNMLYRSSFYINKTFQYEWDTPVSFSIESDKYDGPPAEQSKIRNGGTLKFKRGDKNVLVIGEKDDNKGSPYNRLRFEGNEVHFLLNSTGSMFQAKSDQVQIRHSDKAKLILSENGVQTTELYFRNLGFTGSSPEMEDYLKGNSVQKITYDILKRLEALENGSSGGSGNCEAITEAELNAMFEEIGL